MNRLSSRRLRAWFPTAALAVVCYVPLLFTHVGQVGADTKSYLYIDPSRLLARAWSMWDPNVGLGTVTHQNIGYLWPMGPFFWAFHAVGAPAWVAQRLWLGSILFLAGVGVRYLMRTLGQSGVHVSVSMFIYGLSPYVLTLAARISALLLPFVGLPWMIGLVVRATRERRWLHPALFALLIPTVGSTNATALILAGLGPLLWLPFAIFVLGELTIRQALAVLGRIGVLTVGTSLWWIAGLYCQGSFGINVLKYSETAQTVAAPATAPELLRSLGYWFFYGDDKIGPWIEPSVPYTQSLLLIIATYVLAAIGLLSAGFVRWRYRAFFVGLVVVGLVAGVGGHPWTHPPLWGRLVQDFLSTGAGLAMRSLPRAVPLLALGLAVLAGMGVAAVGAWARRMARPLTVAMTVLAIGCLPPLWTGTMVANNLQRPEQIPKYWQQDATYLDQQGRGQDGFATRVLEMPGSDFASYRWGNTVDPVLPGMMNRPYVARELIPYGTPVSADLLDSFDGQLQDGVLDPSAIAPIARFMGVGDINIRSDLQYERYNLARPRQTWQLFTSTPGLGKPTGFGGNAPNVPNPEAPLDDEQELASPPDLPNPPKVAAFPVDDPQSIIRAIPATSPVVMAGSGEGLVDAAGAGLLSGKELVLYSASLAGDRPVLDQALAQPGASLLLTDTNRKQATRWGTVYDNGGYTEPAAEKPLVVDPTDNRLPEFPDATTSAETVAEQRGGVLAQASAYGNPVTYTPEDRAANAVDRDPRTAWTVGGFSPVNGERIQLTYPGGVTTDGVDLTQANQGVQNRWITKVQLRFDGGAPVTESLGLPSRTSPGQTITFGSRSFHTLSITITATDVGRRDNYDNLSAVGFADIRLLQDDHRLDEVIRLPEDLLDAAGAHSADDPLSIVLTRLRSRPTDALRDDEELDIARAFSLPTGRPFTVSGQARISTRADEPVVDKILGITGTKGGSLVTATSDRRLAGSIPSGAYGAIDDDIATHFSPGFLGQVGDYVKYTVAKPITFDHMVLRVVNDGRHSVPTRIRIEADGKVAAGIDIPAVPDQKTKDGTVAIPLHFPAVTGKTITVVIEKTRDVMTNDWVSKLPIVMPVGLAELGIPGLHATVPTGAFDSGCRSDLLTIDGKAVPIEVKGTMAQAVAGDPMKITGCKGSAVRLSAGSHTLRTGEGKNLGIDVDQLVLRSPSASGRAVPTAATPAPASPPITLVANGRDNAAVKVGPRPTATWLVLGQSTSLGWKASIDGKSLGAPVTVNGYANGWLIPAGRQTVKVTLAWTPQRVVWGAILGSVLAAIACLALVLLGWRARRRTGEASAAIAGDQPAAFQPSVLWRSTGTPPSIRATVLTTVLAAIAGAVVIGPISGVVIGLATVAALHWRRARFVTVAGAAVTMLAAGAFTVVSQYRHQLPPGFEWPTYFEKVHQLAYVGVALLAVDLVVDRLWTGRWGVRTDADHATADHDRAESR